MKRNEDELDERGYPQEAHNKVSAFLQDFEKNPEDYPDFLKKIYYPTQLTKPTGEPYSTDEEKFRRAAELYLFEKVEVDLGTAISWNETGIVGKCPRCQWRCRKCYGDCFAWFSHPLLDEIRDDVRDCAISAAVITTLTVIWTSTAAALPVFEEAFYTCLTTKGIEWAREIGVGLRTEERCGDWHKCG